MQSWHLIGLGVCTLIPSNTANVTTRYDRDPVFAPPSQHALPAQRMDGQGLFDGIVRGISALASSGSTGAWMIGSFGPYSTAWQ